MTSPDNTAKALTFTARSKSFEWTLIENEPHVIHTAKKPEPEIPEKIEVPDFRTSCCREEIQRFTLPAEIHDSEHLVICARRWPRRFASSPGSRDDKCIWSKIAIHGRAP